MIHTFKIGKNLPSLLIKYNYPILLLLSIGILFFASMSFDIGLRGVIVETHPGFWVLIGCAIYYAFKIQRTNYFGSALLIFVIGVGVRLLVGFHTLYPGSGPWMEFASVSYIKSNGFILDSYYYHSGMPVLQFLILILESIAGYYLTLVFIIPIIAWAFNYIMLYFFCRLYFSTEKTLVALLLLVPANILFQSITRAESIAIPLGMLIIYILFRKNLQISNTESFLAIGLYVLLILTHHLTSAVIMLVLISLTIAEWVFRRHISINLMMVSLSSLLIFFSYWEIYQGLLSEKLTEIFIAEHIIPTPLPKPIWWWILYLLPKCFTAILTICFIAHVIRLKTRNPTKEELMTVSSIGGITNVLAMIMPGGYMFLRIFHQFFGYHILGMSHLRGSKIMLKILVAIFFIGLLADFPIINSNSGNLIGGHWFDHSKYEVEGAEFLATNVPSGSRIVIDDRIESLLYIYVTKRTLSPKQEPDVYGITSTEEAWDYSINRNYDYILVSKFYETMFVFKGGTEATKFSEEQLAKFQYPLFIEVFRNEEVVIYKVNYMLE